MTLLHDLPLDIWCLLSNLLYFDDVVPLWLCGSVRVRLKLELSFTSAVFNWNGVSLFSLPGMIKFFLHLETCVLANHSNIAHVPFKHVDVSLLPKTLQKFAYRNRTLNALLFPADFICASVFPSLTDLEVPYIWKDDPEDFVKTLPRTLRRLSMPAQGHLTDFGFSGWSDHLPPQLEVLSAPGLYVAYDLIESLPQSIREWNTGGVVPRRLFDLLPNLESLNYDPTNITVFSIPIFDMDDSRPIENLSLHSVTVDWYPPAGDLFQLLPRSIRRLVICHDPLIYHLNFTNMCSRMPHLQELYLTTQLSANPWAVSQVIRIPRIPPSLRVLKACNLHIEGPGALFSTCPHLKQLEIADTSSSEVPFNTSLHG